MLGNNFVLCEGHVIHAEEEIDIAAFGYQTYAFERFPLHSCSIPRLHITFKPRLKLVEHLLFVVSVS